MSKDELASENERSEDLISILIPVYKVGLYIERCARSLFEQTYTNIEYIFIDDCSPDDSREILENVIEEYPNRKEYVKIISHSTNLGLSAARNTGVRNSKGRYMMHVDSDDYLELDAVERMYKKAIDTNADIVICNYYIVTDNKKYIVNQLLPLDNVEYIKLMLKRRASPSVWGKLYLRDFYINTKVQSIEGVNHGEDFAVLPRLVYYTKKIEYINLPLYNYVQYNLNSCSNNISQKSIDDLIKVNSVLEHFFLSKEDACVYNEYIITAKLRTIIYLLRNTVDNEMIYKIINLYSDLMHKYNYSLSLLDRIMIYLAQNKYYFILKIYVRIINTCLVIFKYK